MYTKKFKILLLIMILGYPTWAQVPEIYEISKRSAAPGELITVRGSGFEDLKENLIVYFGSSKALITQSSRFFIEVVVPAGASNDHVYVTNLISNKTGYSREKFLPCFNGGAFDIARLIQSMDEYVGPSLLDLCVSDFDGDGLNDIATANQVDAASPTVNIYHNRTPGQQIEPVFARILDTDMTTGKAVRNITCGDLNGDGKPDIVAGKGGNTADRLYIFKNLSLNGSIDFDKPATLLITSGASSSSTRRLKIADIDGDGKPEIIMTDQNLGQVHIFQNLSTTEQIVFSPVEKTVIESPNGRPTLGLDITDFNNDGKPEIIFSSNLESGLFIATNGSSPGTIAFDQIQSLNVGSKLSVLRTADLDLDGDLDIVANDWGMKESLIIVNNGTIDNPNFAAPISVKLSSNPWGLDIGDFNGDDLPDLVIAIRPEGQTQMQTAILLNKFNGGSWDFDLFAAGENRHYVNIKVTDLNGDAKPDIAYVSDEGYTGIIRNTHCIKPSTAPSNSRLLCKNQSIKLWANWAPKANYIWHKNSTDVPGATERSLQVNESGDYQVSILSAEDVCNQISSEVNITTSDGDVPLPPKIRSRHIFCEEDYIKVLADSILIVPVLTYHWIHPDGNRTTGDFIEFTDASIEETGRYRVVAVSLEGCISDPAFSTIEVNQLPIVQLTASNAPYFCAGTEATLYANEVANAGYLWQENGNILTITEESHIQVGTGGSYSVIVADEFGCKAESTPVLLEVVQKPLSTFNSLQSACIGDPVNFYNQSTGDAKVSLKFEWDFGDDVFSVEKDPVHNYQTGNVFYPSLKVYYENIDMCEDISGYAVEIGETPDLRFMVSGEYVNVETLNMCQGDTIELWVNASENDLLWNTGATDPFIRIYDSGLYSISASANGACANSNQLNIVAAPQVELTLEVENKSIKKGESTYLVASGASYYDWSPIISLDDATISNPIASPTLTTTYEVKGTSEYGCQDMDTITVFVEDFEEIWLEVKTAHVFSPNGDGKNDFWIIQNIEEFEGCPIRIVDRAGMTIYEAGTYHNDWDGTNNGIEVPEGAYYYFMQCDNSQQLSGAITLLR